MTARHKAAFLDRDGVINVDSEYVYRVEDYRFLPGAIEGLKRLRDKGYRLAVITNQSGIARGYFSSADYERLARHIDEELARHGIELDGVRHCPHLPDAAVEIYRVECGCRKPAPGMILDLAEALDIDLAASVLVGDRPSDLEAGRRAGVGRCWLVRTGKPVGTEQAALADAVFDDLLAVADAL